jgi:hypothetical protein
VAEHALLKRLELNSSIRRIILCLDHGAVDNLLEDRLPALSRNCRRELRLGREDAACAVLEDMAALSLFAAAREYRQLGEAASPDALAEQLHASFQHHENRSALSGRADYITAALAAALKLSGIASPFKIAIQSCPPYKKRSTVTLLFSSRTT